MSLHNFNSTNKSWTMYTHTLSSISGDHLTVKPNDGKNVILEVSENNSVLIKKGTNVYDLSSLITGQSGSISEGIDASFANIDISENLNPLDVNGSSLGLSTKNWNNAYINNIYGENINTTHYSQRFGNNLWNIIGQDISNGPPLTNNNNKIAISNDGKVLAMASSSHSDISKGRVYVYELSYNQTSYNFTRLGLSSEIIVGLSNNDEFGWDIALSSNGRVVAGSSIVSDASGINCGQVRLFELSNNVWRQKGLNINGPRANSESGYSISLAGNGNSIAIGAWKDSSNGTNICGAVRVYDFSSSINDWRQKGPTIFGISGSNEGYATALSLDGQTLACGNPSHNTSTSTVTTITNTATGGTITTSGSYRIHSFTTVGTSTFTPSFSGSVEVLIVAGGGGGGQSLGGGGGGGGVIYIPSVNVTSGTNYSIVVGDGGASSTNGQNSSAFTSIAAGGGCGGEYRDINGKDGGCGGGAGTTESNLVYGGRGHTELVQAGITTGINIRGSNSNAIMHGFRGGNLTVARGGNWKAPGGGGAGAQGLDTDPLSPNDAGQYGASSGGQGISYNILGTSYYWAGGGGGGNWNAARAGWGALGGGGGGSGVVGGPGGGSALNSGFSGNTAQADGSAGGAGGANTGGGGGGGAYGNPGGKGGSGIVVIRYLEQVTISTSIVNLNVGLVKIFSWSGTTWAPKGTIQGPTTIQGRDISNSYFGRAINLSANGNAIVIGAVTTLSKVFELNVSNLTIEQHTTNALNNGRTIASILNAEENEQVRQLLASVGRSWAFIGGKRRPNSTAGGKTSADWQWLNGDIWSYTNFRTGEPNNVSEINLHFVTGDNGWNDTGALTDAAIYRQDLRNAQVYVYSFVGDTSWNQLGTTLQTSIQGSNDIGLYVSMSNDGSIISVGTNDISSNRRSYVNVYKYVNNNWIQLGQTISGSVINSSLAFNHALSGDGTTLFHNIGTQSSRVYGMDKWLTLNSNILMISGDLFTSGNLNPLNNNRSSLGLATKTWGNAYLRDLSVGSIEVSGNILFSRTMTSNLGSVLNRWDTFFADDLSINNINGQVYRERTSTLSVSGGLIPINNNILKLGDVSRNWRNAYIRDMSVGSIDVSLNLNPLISNGSSLGLITKMWGNAYLRDLSVSSIDVSLSLTPLISNGSRLGLITKIWGNAYLRDLSVSSIDVSQNLNPLLANGSSLGLISKNWGNAYIRDMSVGSIDVSSNLNPLLNNGSSLGLSTKMWGNAYIRDISVSSIDVSLNINPLLNNGSSLGLLTRMWRNAYIRDISVSSIDVSTNLITPLLNNTSNLGLPTRIWSNAYIRDISVTSLDVSGNIIPLITNNSNLGSSLNRWKTLFTSDLSVNTINGQVYTSGGTSINLSSISGNIIPSVTNTYNLGDVSRNWNNAYIRNLRVSNRAYQEISGDISWSAVNGHYGLSKDAYPSLNPLSSGVKAVQTWTARTSQSGDWLHLCWSPELCLFVAVAYTGTNRVMTSNNGINWTARTPAEANGWHSVCWSSELIVFVAVATTGTNRVMTSPDGITWTARSASEANEWKSLCWSAELGLFVAIATSGTNRLMTSPNGITWTTRLIPEANVWTGICWSKELGIFVAVANSGNNRVMTSSNGITWNSQYIPLSNWLSVCWSPQLGLFVALAYGSNIIITSSNGITWIERLVPEANGWLRVTWCAEIELFIAVAITGTNRVMTSSNGINWVPQLAAAANQWYSVCWSPELGIAVAVADTGTNRVMTSSLKGRPPTSYNVFDSSFNNIDETGKWTFQNVATTTLTVNGANVTSDDRLKHNEVVINNGLDVIDKLCPKFYQKTLDMLDASYNGDLSGQTWSYEAGLIAQEVLQVPDLSYVVSGGDIYDLSNNLIQKEKYGLAYNNIFVYGIAAIKELHAKVKIHETGVLDEQLNSLVTRLEALEQNIS